MVRIEQNLFRVAAEESGCRLFNNITLVEEDVKGGEAVHLALDIRHQQCYSGIRSAK